MNQDELKQYIINDIDARLPVLLDYIECHKIKCYKNDYRCALPSSKNATKVRIYKDNLYVTIFTDGESINGDIYNLIQYIKDISFYQSILLVHQCFNLNPTKTYKVKDDTNYGLQTLKKIRHKRKRDTNTITYYDLQILNQYINKPSTSLLLEGITIATQKKYHIRLDIFNKRIIFPHYAWDRDCLVGLVGRTEISNYNDLLIAKYISYFNTAFKSINLYGLKENLNNIKTSKQIVVFESEKSVLKLDVFTKGEGNGVALGSHQLSNKHINILMQIGFVNEIVIALDKDIDLNYSLAIINRLEKMFFVTAIIDVNNLLNYNDSPVDKGVDVWQTLYNNRLNINELREVVNDEEKGNYSKTI